MDDNPNPGPPIVLRMLGHDRQWSVLHNGAEIGKLSYYDIRPYLLGKLPKTELLTRFGVNEDGTNKTI